VKDDVVRSISALHGIIRDLRSTIVAYSGGVDSAVVLAIAHAELGERAIGIIGNSPSYPSSELADALALARRIGAPVRVIQTDEHLDPRYLANDANRCFYCRAHLFGQLRRLAGEQGCAHVVDGVHGDDQKDHAGGMRAARELGVRSPLLEAGLNKAAVRAIARHLGLPVWEKPAMACLASRVPVGTAIQLSMFSRVACAEQALRELGFSDLRVRHHGNLARIELSSNELDRALQLSETIVRRVRDAGYRHVTLDLTPRHTPDFSTITEDQ